MITPINILTARNNINFKAAINLVETSKDIDNKKISITYQDTLVPNFHWTSPPNIHLKLTPRRNVLLMSLATTEYQKNHNRDEMYKTFAFILKQAIQKSLLLELKGISFKPLNRESLCMAKELGFKVSTKKKHKPLTLFLPKSEFHSALTKIKKQESKNRKEMKTVQENKNYFESLTAPSNGTLSKFADNIYQSEEIGDCYLLSSIYSLTRNPLGNKLLSEMIKPAKNGKVAVRFPGYPRESIVFDPSEIDEGPHVTANKKVQILEHALYLLKKRVNWYYKHLYKNTPESKSSWLSHSSTENVLEILTNRKVNNIGLEQPVLAGMEILDMIDDKKHIAACIQTNIDVQDGLKSSHVYSIVNLNKEHMIIANPHDTRKKIKLDYDTVFKNFDQIQYVKL